MSDLYRLLIGLMLSVLVFVVSATGRNLVEAINRNTAAITAAAACPP